MAGLAVRYGRDVDSDGLTDEQTALVLRRAAELDCETRVEVVGLDPATLEDVAVEAGLSRESVRRALAELRLGTLPAPPAGRRSSRSLFGPDTVTVHRGVAAPAPAVEALLREYLESQLFRVIRDIGGGSLWSPRDDLKASVQRTVDRTVQRRLVLGDVGRIQAAVTAERAEDRSVVHLEVNVREVRRASGRMVLAGSAVGAAAIGGSLLLAGLDPATVVALPVGAGAAYAGHRLGTSHYRLRVSEIETALQGALDGLDGRAAASRRR